MQLNTVAWRVHQTILAIDRELSVAVDTQYRQRLVKAAYALRNLEELILFKPADCTHNLGLERLCDAFTVPKEKVTVAVR